MFDILSAKKTSLTACTGRIRLGRRADQFLMVYAISECVAYVIP